MTARPAALATLLLAALPAFAQTSGAIYRCGPDGRQLQQAPCGTAKPAAITPAPSTADRAEAAAVARRDAALADRMTAEREARERREARLAAPAIGIGVKPPPPPASAAAKTRDRKKRRA